MGVMQKVLLGLMALFAVVAVLRLFSAPLKLAGKLVVNTLLGLALLGLLSVTGLLAKLSLGWNLFNALVVAVLGVPGLALLILLRLIPAVPYNLINYAFGLTAMPFRTYLAASAIGIIPGTLAFINIGDKALDITSPDFWIALGLLGALLLATALLGKAIFPKEKKENKCNE